MARVANLCKREQIFSSGKVGKQLYKEEQPRFYEELPYGLRKSFSRVCLLDSYSCRVSAIAGCLQVWTVILRCTLLCTRYWCNLKNGYFWRSLHSGFKDCSHFIAVRKEISLTWLIRNYNIYIRCGTPSGTSFFIFSEPAQLNTQ